MPRCNTEAMNLHLAEIATQIAPGAHAALLVELGRLASLGPAHRAAHHHPDPVPAKCPEFNPQGKRLPVHPRKLAVKQDLQILRRHRRSLLRRMEQAHRSPLADHIHRPTRLGLCVRSPSLGISLPMATRPSSRRDGTLLQHPASGQRRRRRCRDDASRRGSRHCANR
jgi:hypothetical protein